MASRLTSMRRIDRKTAGCYTKRLAVYILGLFLIALGVSVSKASDLGVAPVNSIPAVLSEILGTDIGICTTAVFIGFILLQICIMRREFKIKNLLQILCSTLFGYFVSLTNMLCVAFLPTCPNYFFQILYILISIVLVALGILLYIEADILSMPAEGVMQALSCKTGIAFSTAKLIFDWSVIIIAAVLSLIFLHSLVGVREGTVIAAFGVGLCLKLITRLLQKPLKRFLRE
ncbi:MAG: YitT family protein [Acutalibacteraceae bacterium]